MSLLSVVFVLFVYFIPASLLMRPEYFLTFFLVLLAGLDKNAPVFTVFKKEIIFILLLASFAVIAILLQNLTGGKLIWRDLMILVRYFYYALAILAGGYLASKVLKHVYLIRMLQFLILLSIIISIFQYFNIFGASNYMVPIYSQKYETLLTGVSWRRIIGTWGNANYWGLLLDFGVIYSVYMVILKRKYIWLIPIPLLLISILYTGSRTTIIALILSSFPALFIINKANKVNVKTLVAVALIIAIGVFVKSFVFSGDVEIYDNQSRFDTGNLLTLEMRINHWQGILSGLADNPYQIVFGGGASKSSIVIFGDNMYVRYLRDYGLFSLLIYLALLKTMVYRARAAMGRAETNDAASVLLWCILCFMIFDLAADAWFDARIIGFLLFSYGYVLMLNYKSRKQNI